MGELRHTEEHAVYTVSINSSVENQPIFIIFDTKSSVYYAYKVWMFPPYLESVNTVLCKA